MKFSALNEMSPQFYATSTLSTDRISRVRGPGRHLWCALEALKTLNSGGKVWVKAGTVISERTFSEAIFRVRDFIPLGRRNEYEFSPFFAAGSLKGERVFGDYSFSETVGLWLEKGGKGASGLLSPFISTEGFSFTPEEYVDLLERLRAALRRYERLPAVSNGLEDLNTGFFRHRSLEESTAFIRGHLIQYLQRGAELQRRFLLTINRHARSGAIGKRRELRHRMARLESLTTALDAADQLSGRQQKKAITDAVNKWQTYLRECLGDGSEETSVPGGIEALRTEVEQEVEKIGNGFRYIGRELKTEGMALNALTVDPRYGDPDSLRELEAALTELLREVDEAGLYQLPLRLSDAATTPRQLQQLDKLLEKLRNTDRHMGELPMFYDRRHFWYAQPARLRRLLAPLLDLPPEDWEAAFNSWYFERCLEREQRPERFHQQVVPTSPKPVSATPSSVSGKENLLFLKPEDPWPAAAQANDLLLDLNAGNELDVKGKARACTLAPLSDGSALHLAVSGYRNPVLVFSQPFQLLHPPGWSVHYTEAPPVGTPNGVLLQASAETPWFSLLEWDGRPAEKMNVFLPGELNQAEENALIERWESLVFAAPEITYFHTLSPNDITQGLLSDGLNGAFLISVLLRAAEAAELSPFDHEALIALGKELRIRCGLPDPRPHPLALSFGALIGQHLPEYFVETHVPWRDTFLPLVLQSPSGKKSVLLPDGRLPGFADDETEATRHQELETAGFRVLGLNALEAWEDTEGEVERICGLVMA